MDSMDIQHIKTLTTEQQNLNSVHLDMMSIKDICTLMNQEDQFCIKQIHDAIPAITNLIEACVKCLNQNGRIYYIGAGTSGRLGLLDAVECAPTFSCTNEVNAILAGGSNAFIKAAEGIEDDEMQGQKDILVNNVTAKDIVIGIAASGRTPYVIGALQQATKLGCVTGSIACNMDAKISSYSKFPIEVASGSEVLSGSTRLKAGTVQKLILNMISTISMVKIGKVFENYMVDMKTSNAKLMERSIQMVVSITHCTYEEAKHALDGAKNNVKTAVLMVLLKIQVDEATHLLEIQNGFLRNVLDMQKGTKK